MNRPSRLIEKDTAWIFVSHPHLSLNFELQKGDMLTGFEIIASLPIEEQKLTVIHVRHPDNEFWVRTRNWILNPYTFYTWNGEKWVEGQSAKPTD